MRSLPDSGRQHPLTKRRRWVHDRSGHVVAALGLILFTDAHAFGAVGSPQASPREDKACREKCVASYRKCAAQAGADRGALEACRAQESSCAEGCRPIYVIEFDARTNDFRQVHLVSSGNPLTPVASWPFYPRFVFHRGDDIYLRVINARYDVELNAVTKAGELPVPPLAPIYGAESMPKTVASFDPAIARFAGTAIALPQAGASVFLPAFLRAVAEDPKFDEYLTKTLQDVLENSKILDAADLGISGLLAAVLSEVGAVLDGRKGSPIVPLRTLQSDLAKFNDEQWQPTITEVYTRRTAFNKLLRDRELTTDAMAFSRLKPLADRLAAVRQTFASAEVASALMIDPADVSRLVEALAELGADSVAKWDEGTMRTSALKLKLVNLLKNEGAYSIDALVAALGRLQRNVTLALRYATQMKRMSDTLKAVKDNRDGISTYSANSNTLEALADSIRSVNQLTAAIAIRLNDLPGLVAYEPADQRLGRWFDNQLVTITVGSRKRLRDYDVQTMLAAPQPAGGDVGHGATPQSPLLQDDFKTVRVTDIEIHQLYHFRLSGGFIYSKVRDEDFTVATRTVPDPAGGVNSDGTPKTRQEKFLLQTKNRSYHFFPSLNLVYYPKARDFYPGHTHSPALGVLAGFSLVNPRKDFLFGGNLEFSSMAAVYGGLHLGYVPTKPADINPNDAIPESRVVVIEEKLHPGAFVGVNLDLAFFKQVFSQLFGF